MKRTNYIGLVGLIILCIGLFMSMILVDTTNVAYAMTTDIIGAIGTNGSASTLGAIGGQSIDNAFGNDIVFKDTKYIHNKHYFVNNPLHAKNSVSDNLAGTCTTVALQLILGYHNYYTDRRLIPSVSNIGIRYLDERYGDTTHNPAVHNLEKREIDSLGDPLTGTLDTVYQGIFNNTTWASFPGLGQNLPAVVKGVKKFLNAVSPISGNVSLEYDEYSEADAVGAINSNKPIVLGMHRTTEDNKPSYHVVVAYGYGYYQGEFGYFTHYGYDDLSACIWAPARWFAYQVTMDVNHAHRYAHVEEDETKTRLNCAECGSTTIVDDFYLTSFFGETIIGAKYPMCGNLILPEKIDGKTITAIGNGAFANQTGITKMSIPSTIKSIGANAFDGCTELLQFNIPDDSRLETIGNSAFYNCRIAMMDFPAGLVSIGANAFSNCKLALAGFAGGSVTIGNAAFYGSTIMYLQGAEYIKSIGANAFENSGLVRVDFNDGPQLTAIGNSAFAGCGFLKNFVMPTSLVNVGYFAFSGCSAFETVVIPNSVTTIGGGAFDGCENLTIYTSRANTPSGWVGSWNSLNRPIVLSCTLEGDAPYVKSFTKSASNPFNANAVNGLKNPYRLKLDFWGWYTTADFSGTQYATIAEAPNGTLYAKWEEPTSCVAEGTLITLADGTQKPVEQLTGDEMLLVWNLNTGAFDIAPILFIDKDPRATYKVVNLSFSDGTSVKVISEHAFWDFDLNKYVYLDENASAYIGHWFNKQTTNEDGSLGYMRVQLVGVEVKDEQTMAYSPVTYGHLCYYVNGMLSMPGGISGLFNIFDVDEETLKIDEQKMQEDIETYGLYTYEEFADIVPVSEEVFEAFNGQYLKVAIGKGLIDIPRIQALVERYAEFFV